MLKKMLNGFLRPERIVQRLWLKFVGGSYRTRMEYDIFPRPHYAYCVYHAAFLARMLGLNRISILEFGVAGGRGLLALEELAAEVEAELNVAIEIYGFDTGEGLPAPVDYRDLPYIWKAGFYKMDQDLLRSRLSHAKLVLGDVKDTVPKFFDEANPAPVGAAFFDLDFWSSTADALRIFDTEHEHLLPRIFCYCDDVISAEFGGILNDYVGQLAAIREYNEANTSKKLTRISGFENNRRIPAVWNEQIYVHHSFEHPKYNTYVHPEKDRQLKL